MAKFNLKPIEQNNITQYSFFNIYSHYSNLDIINLYTYFKTIFNLFFVSKNVIFSYNNKYTNFKNELKKISNIINKKNKFMFEFNINLYNFNNVIYINNSIYTFQKKLKKQTHYVINFDNLSSLYTNHIKSNYTNTLNDQLKIF